MVILMDGGGKFLAHIKSLPISDRIKLADAFVQRIKDKKVLLNKALQRAQYNGMSIPSLNCGVLTMALLHDQLAALVWATNDDCILDVLYRKFGINPNFFPITPNDLRQFLTISTALTDDILEERTAVLNTLFQNIPENQRQAFLEKALMGDLGQAARTLSDNDLKLAWFEDMLASYDPNLPDGQQLVDAFVGKPELVKAWEVLSGFTTLRKQVDLLEILMKAASRFEYRSGSSPLKGYEGLKAVLTNHTSAENFILNLKKADELFFDTDGLIYSGIKSSQEVRIIGDGIVLAKVIDQIEQPGSLVKAWEVLFDFPDLRMNIGALDAVTKHRAGEVVPEPTTYLDAGYISNHLAKFDKGGAYLVPTDALDTYGRDLVGRPDGQFISPASEIDDLLNFANGDISIIEKALGIPSGAWQGKQISRIDISNTFAHNRRLPSGNEAGANEYWIPGGLTSGGKLEAVVDPIPIGSYTETIIN